MNIWDSISAMTLVDLGICGAATIAVWSVGRMRGEIRRFGLIGPRVVVAGVLLIGAYFLADLATMWLLPPLVGAERAMAAMRELHLDWSWIVMSVAVAAITVGLVQTSTGLRSVAGRITLNDRLFQDVVESLSEYVVRWQPGGIRTFVNDAYCSEFQTPREKLLGTSFLPLVAPEERERIEQKIAGMTPEDPLGATEVHRVVRPDGSDGWQEWTDRSFFDPQGRLLEIQSVGRDVTERLQAEEALQRSEKRYRDLFELASDGICLLRDLRFVDCNAKALEIFRRPREEIIGATPWELSPPTQADGRSSEEVAQDAVRQLEVSGRKQLEWLHSRGDGSVIELEVYLASIEVDAQPTILASLRDITDRREAEAALREREEQYRAVFESARDSMSIRRLEDARIIAANPAFAEMIGYGMDEIQHLTEEEYVHPDTLSHRDEVLEALREGHNYHLAGQLIRKDGKLIDVAADYVPMSYRGSRHILAVSRDITEEKRAAEELRVSEEKFSKVFHGSPEPMVISALDPPRMLAVNAAFEEQFGYEESEVAGRSSTDVGLWAVPEVRDRMIHELATKGSMFVPEVELLTKQGESRLYEVSAYALQLGSELCSAVIGRDITERRRAEIALQESEEQYRAVFEAAGEGFTIRRQEDAKLLAANPTFERLSGYTEEELLEMPRSRYIHADTLAHAPAILERLSAGKGYELVGQLIHKDGHLVDLSTHWVPMQYKGKDRILSVSRDVTDEIRAAEALRLSEEKLSKFFNSSLDATGIGSLETGRILEVNPQFESLLGYEREELIGESGLELGIWVNPRHRANLLQDLDVSGEVRVPEAQFRTKTGKVVVCELSAFKLEVAGEACWGVVARDITQRLRIEAEKEKAWSEIARLKEELERERDYLREEVTTARKFGEIIGDSAALRQVLERIEAVAATNAGVLIQGESGVGKELVAREIHARSPRSSGPLVRVNCASVPRELFESEFFGHVKGAFTGAYRDRVGRFQLANEGTLFLDEVGEIPPELQAKLLRALQEGEYQRVGEERTRKSRVRVIAATNSDLKAEAGAGRFREDLYYRLSVFPIEVPPLRERREDILALAQYFLQRACREFGRAPLVLSRQQAEGLFRHDWPGNVRELRNVIEQAVILSRGERLRLDLALPNGRQGAEPESDPGVQELGFVSAAELKRRERANLVAALEHAGWKVSGPNGAAELLGLKPTTLRYQMKAHGIGRSA